MPVTRSITSTPVRGVKRSLATPATPVSPTPRPKRAKKQPLPSTDVAPPTPASSHQDVPTSVVPAPAEAILPEEPAGPVPLTFDIAAAKSHLSALDPRFSSLFAQLPCKPFEGEDLERAMNPFRSLATSILGQQVSWLAAKAITYRFCRLFFPDLPEKLEPGTPPAPFPSPAQLASSSVPHLRTAGLSGRKAEYVLDLASRFADGRLSGSKLREMDDAGIMEELIQVRGIGKWTVEMFLIFSMRHPDVLPCGDLGIQKGLLRWYTTPRPVIIPAKIPKTADPLVPTTLAPTPDTTAPPPPGPPATAVNDVQGPRTPEPEEDDFTLVASQSLTATPRPKKAPRTVFPPTPISPATTTSTPSASPVKGEADQAAVTDFTGHPRLNKDGLPPIPEGSSLTHATLRSRLKKPIKNGLYLTPAEMEELTNDWRPYRSLGIWYLWTLQDGGDSSI